MSVRGVYERGELMSSESDDLRVENQQLYRLILQLILDLNELEDACGRQSTAHSCPVCAPIPEASNSR